MKMLILLLCVQGFANVATAQEVPLLVKSTYSGYVPENYQRGESCSVYPGKVVIERTYGRWVTKQVLPLEYSTESLQEVIKNAKAEVLTKRDNSLCDGPSTYIRTGEAENPLVIYSTGGCGVQREQREGPNSRIISDLLGQYCTQIH